MANEKIGSVVLNLDKYPGEDFYCDGTVEDEILDIVKNHSCDEFSKIIEEKKSWPILYHLSELRGNIIEWLPITSTSKVLEIGSGCGAITSTLCKKAGEVTCVDLSKKRSSINAYRNKEKSNITIHVGNFKDIEPGLPCDYDYVLLIGVFEYGQGYIGGDTPYEDFLTIMKRHLKPEGNLVIAIENKFGLKYWAGCKEDHVGKYFAGLEDYPEGGGVRTFTRKGLEKMLLKTGFTDYAFYYPYPDYKFMHSIYSDAYLPKPGELSTNMRNFDRERMLLFDEKSVFDTILKEEEFPLFSNSYMVITGSTPSIKYSKYSNERSKQYCIRTDVVKNDNNEQFVRKTALSDEAKKHCSDILKICEKLTEKYEGSGLTINRCIEQSDGSLSFEFAEGKSLEELLDDCIRLNQEDEFKTLISEYDRLLKYNEEFGYSDIDFIFQNILVSDKGWTLIDYEWTYPEKISAKEIAYRAWYCYQMGSEKRKGFLEDWVKTLFGVDAFEIEKIKQNEAEFQKKVTGQRFSLGDMRDAIGNPVVNPIKGQKTRVGGEELRYKVQLYFDYGNGFSENDSVFLPDCYVSENRIEFEYDCKPGVRMLRIDPAMFACMVSVKEITLDGKRIDFKKLNLGSGTKVGKNGILYATEDPGFSLKMKKDTKSVKLSVKIDIVRMGTDIAEGMIN